VPRTEPPQVRGILIRARQGRVRLPDKPPLECHHPGRLPAQQDRLWPFEQRGVALQKMRFYVVLVEHHANIRLSPPNHRQQLTHVRVIEMGDVEFFLPQ